MVTVPERSRQLVRLLQLPLLVDPPGRLEPVRPLEPVRVPVDGERQGEDGAVGWDEVVAAVDVHDVVFVGPVWHPGRERGAPPQQL